MSTHLPEHASRLYTLLEGAVRAVDVGAVPDAVRLLEIALDVEFIPEVAQALSQLQANAADALDFDLRDALPSFFGEPPTEDAYPGDLDMAEDDSFFGSELVIDFDDPGSVRRGTRPQIPATPGPEDASLPAHPEADFEESSGERAAGGRVRYAASAPAPPPPSHRTARTGSAEAVLPAPGDHSGLFRAPGMATPASVEVSAPGDLPGDGALTLPPVSNATPHDDLDLLGVPSASWPRSVPRDPPGASVLETGRHDDEVGVDDLEDFDLFGPAPGVPTPQPVLPPAGAPDRATPFQATLQGRPSAQAPELQPPPAGTAPSRRPVEITREVPVVGHPPPRSPVEDPFDSEPPSARVFRPAGSGVHAAQPRGSSQGVNVSNVPTAGGRPTRELEPLPMPMTAVPTLTKVAAQRHQLNPRSMFLLDQVDGMCSVQDLIDISGMSQAQALEVLRQLLQEGWIELR